MSCNHDCTNCSETCGERKTESLLEKPNKYSSVKKIIGVVSGKGGVGKSMVTSLLAVTLAKQGYSIGILDADITGPSIPKAFGINKPLEGNKYGTFPSKTKGGIQIVSTNLLLQNETDPVIWRGPVVANLVKQYWKDVIWKDIDYLLVDMPPGTGDVPLTVYQSMPISGIIVVTTPQDLVSMIVQKAINMAKMMNIEVLGLVENMSYIVCPDCSKEINIFGESKIEQIAESLKTKVLGRLPIDHELSTLVDKGRIEEYNKDYLDNAVAVFESLPVNVLNIAASVDDNENISSNLGHCKKFNLYTCINQMVISKHQLLIEGDGHEEVIGELQKYNINVILTGSVGEKAKIMLEDLGIIYIPQLDGNADELAIKYLYNELNYQNNDYEFTCKDSCGEKESCTCEEKCSCNTQSEK